MWLLIWAASGLEFTVNGFNVLIGGMRQRRGALDRYLQLPPSSQAPSLGSSPTEPPGGQITLGSPSTELHGASIGSGEVAVWGYLKQATPCSGGNSVVSMSRCGALR